MRNRGICRAAAAVALVVAASSSAGSSALASSPRRTALGVGVSYGGQLFSLSDAQLDAMLDDTKALGAVWVREQIDWAYVQYSSPDQWRWDAFDRVAAAVRRHHLKLLAVLTFTPPWARSTGCLVEQCAPTDPAAFARFAGAAARRYSRLGVHTWELWNEPNLSLFWQPAPDAHAYTALVTASASAIRSADTSAKVISGGLSPATSSLGNIDPRTFVAQLCADGAVAAVDGVGVHPYSYPALPDQYEEWSAWSQLRDTPVSIRGILQACGAANKPLYATEYGAPTGGVTGLSEQTQAEMASESVIRAAADRLMAMVVWHTARDRPGDPLDPENAFGLRRVDGTAKPAYAALADAIRSTR